VQFVFENIDDTQAIIDSPDLDIDMKNCVMVMKNVGRERLSLDAGSRKYGLPNKAIGKRDQGHHPHLRWTDERNGLWHGRTPTPLLGILGNWRVH